MESIAQGIIGSCRSRKLMLTQDIPTHWSSPTGHKLFALLDYYDKVQKQSAQIKKDLETDPKVGFFKLSKLIKLDKTSPNLD